MSTRRNFLKLIAAIPVIGPLLVAPPVVDDWPKGESKLYDFWAPLIIEEKLPTRWVDGRIIEPDYHAYSSEARDEAVKKVLEAHLKRNQT